MHLLDIHDGMLRVYEQISVLSLSTPQKKHCLHGSAKRRIVCKVDDVQSS